MTMPQPLANDPWAYLWALGYRRLIPIIPPECETVVSIDPESRGKVPGEIGEGGRWRGVRDWQNRVATESDLERWRDMGASIGVLTGYEVSGVDADCYESADALAAAGVIERYIPGAPIRVGQSPKAIHAFRPIEDDFPYHMFQFGEFSPNGKQKNRIEIIGRGRQFVAHGVHPITKMPYRWTRRLVPPNELPALTAAQAELMMAELHALMPNAGARMSSSALGPAPDQETLRGDPAAVGRAVAAIPNTSAHFPSRDSYVRVGYAIKAAVADEAAAFDLYSEWCARWTDGVNDPEQVATDWRGMKPEFHIGASWLYEQATTLGGVPAAVFWFDELPPDPEPPRVKTWPTTFTLIDPATLPTRQSLYGGHYVRKWLSSTIAPSKVGKSSLVLAEALAMVSGKPLLGVQPSGQFRVWWWNGEDPKDELDRRAMAAIQHFGLTAAEVGDRLMIDSGRDSPLLLAAQGKTGGVLNDELCALMEARIRENRIDASIFDPLISLHRISENDNNGIDLLAKRMNGIANATNSAIEAPHHTRKLYGGGATVEDGRGASALLATVRSSRALARMTKEEARALAVPEGLRRALLRFADVSSNLYLPGAEAEERWMRLESVNLGNGEGDGLDKIMRGDSVGVLTLCDLQAAKAAMKAEFEEEPTDAAEREAAALTAIRKGEWRRDARSGDWVGIPIARAFGIDRDTEDGAAKLKTIIKEWIAHGKLIEEDRRGPDRKMRTYVSAIRQDVTDDLSAAVVFNWME